MQRSPGFFPNPGIGAGSCDREWSVGAGIDPEFRDDVARIIEASEKAANTWTVTCTDFFPPPVVFGATAILRNIAGVSAIPWGGYPQARQQRAPCSLL